MKGVKGQVHIFQVCLKIILIQTLREVLLAVGIPPVGTGLMLMLLVYKDQVFTS